MQDLIERLEKADGPDRELGNDILFAAGWTQNEMDYGGGNQVTVWMAPDDTEYLDGDHPDPTKSIDAAVALLPSGFWWRGGTCYLSSEATVCPDHNNPEHRERLLRECPPSIEHWDSGIEVEIRPGSDHALARAICAASLRARHALSAVSATERG
jgi:hypothetical protein